MFNKFDYILLMYIFLFDFFINNGRCCEMVGQNLKFGEVYSYKIK